MRICHLPTNVRKRMEIVLLTYHVRRHWVTRPEKGGEATRGRHDVGVPGTLYIGFFSETLCEYSSYPTSIIDSDFLVGRWWLCGTRGLMLVYA